MGCFLWHTGQIADCEANMKPAAEYVSARIDAPEGTPELEELLSDIYLVTGILADCIGVSKRDQSLDHRLKLLGLREKAHKAIPPAEITVDDEIRLGNARTDLACAHMQRAEYTKAGEIIEEMLPHYRRWGSEADYPYEYSKYYEYSAFVLMADGDPDKAIVHARKGADLEERHAGQVDSTVLIAHYSIASLLFNAGKVQESLKLHEEVLKERRRLCGEGSQYTLESLETTGVLLHLTQNNVRAKQVIYHPSTSYGTNIFSKGASREVSCEPAQRQLDGRGHCSCAVLAF